MPQLTEFPFLGDLDPSAAVDTLLRVCREVPAEGETLAQFRNRLRDAKIWDRERLEGTLRFFRMADGDVIVPSEVMRGIATAPDGTSALTRRLWDANPVLFKGVIEHLAERVAPPEELYSFIDSFAYPGDKIPRAHLRSWVQLARGLRILKVVGVAIGLSERGQDYLERARALVVAEYISEDTPETLPASIRRAAEAETAAAAAAPEAAVPAQPAGALPTARVPAPPATRYPSPLGRGRPVPPASFAGQAVFADEVLADTSQRLAAWWAEQSAAAAAAGSPAAADFGIGGDTWMEGSDEALYRLAVAAALVFRLGGGRDEVRAVFAGLDGSGVLASLYHGTAPDDLAHGVDPRALMLASLVARRCAEQPDLAAELEKQRSAADAFAVLDRALGRGLFRLELFWLLRALGDVGAVRFDDLADFTALPHRLVRDTLFRLGYLATPYAADAAALAAAAAAARRALGGPGADEALAGFALSAGCAYDCGNRKRCEYACRERAE
ncbi:MAG TPA: hypothetical protein VL172_11140 [Kofleriaceae bacterium]|jgi:hypothetical protein|nr:hypothetical protein [Kofleriaceae bacterium]